MHPHGRARVAVLGPVELVIGAGTPAVRLARLERAALAILALDVERAVPVERFVDLLWADGPPASARGRVQVLISTLRGHFARAGLRDAIVWDGAGYLLTTTASDVDLIEWEEIVRHARAHVTQGRLQAADEAYTHAQLLWRGPPLAGLDFDFAAAESDRLYERQNLVTEEHIDVRLAGGQAEALIPDLVRLVARRPVRERVAGQLMRALVMAGRRAEALDTYREVWRRLDDEHGIQPSEPLRALHREILEQRESVPAPDGVRADDGGVRPAQLPADVVNFVGRDAMLDHLDGLLDARPAAPSMCLVTGMGGVGKTALAVHWAHRVRHRFPDGQLYIDLRGYAHTPPLRPVEALARFLRALGVPPGKVPADDVDEAAALFRSLLADRRMAVLLDNARDAEQVRPLLPGSATCLVLVTSRSRLTGLVARDGAHEISVDVLTSEEAHTLLRTLLGPEIAGDPAAVAELALLCGYMPLALRIAAANVAQRGHESLAEYLRGLRHGDRLTGLTVAGDPHTTIRATFAHSYAALPADAARTFRLLGLTPCPEITNRTVAALTGCRLAQAEDLIAALVAAHLLHRVSPGRYTLHDLLRDFAHEQAAAHESVAEQRAAVERLLWHYLRAADAAARLLYPGKLRLALPDGADEPDRAVVFDGDVDAGAWLDTERANLVALVTQAARHGPRRLSWLLADTLRGYFHLRLHTVDWLSTAEPALVAAQAEGDLPAQCAAHLSLASLYWRLGHYDASIDQHQQALDLASSTDWPDAQAAALSNLATVYAELGRVDIAGEHMARALRVSRRIGGSTAIAVALCNLGLLRLLTGQLPEAARHMSEALGIYRETGFRNGEAIALGNLGTAYVLLGRFDDGLEHLQRALDIQREVRDPARQAEILRQMAATHLDRDRTDAALDLARAALDLARQVGRRRVEAEALTTIAGIHHRIGNHRAAVAEYADALRLAEDTGDRYPQVVALVGLAAVRGSLGGQDQARTHAERAILLARSAGYRLQEGFALTRLAELALVGGDPHGATGSARRALAVLRRTGCRLGLADALAVLGQAHHAAGRTGAAAGRLHQAQAIYLHLGLSQAWTRRLLRGPGPSGPRCPAPGD